MPGWAMPATGAPTVSRWLQLPTVKCANLEPTIYTVASAESDGILKIAIHSEIQSSVSQFIHLTDR